jgi:hypothetical protein
LVCNKGQFSFHLLQLKYVSDFFMKIPLDFKAINDIKVIWPKPCFFRWVNLALKKESCEITWPSTVSGKTWFSQQWEAVLLPPNMKDQIHKQILLKWVAACRAKFLKKYRRKAAKFYKDSNQWKYQKRMITNFKVLVFWMPLWLPDSLWRLIWKYKVFSLKSGLF